MPRKTKRAARDLCAAAEIAQHILLQAARDANYARLAMRHELACMTTPQLDAVIAEGGVRAELAEMAKAQRLHKRTLVEKAASYDKLKASLQDTLSGQVWSADILDTIATILRGHGVVIQDPAEHPEA